MARIGPGKPFTRGGVTYPSQYAYRKAKAEEAGFASVRERTAAIEKAKTDLERYLAAAPEAERGVLAAQVADWQGKLDAFREGAEVSDRASNRLPPGLLNALKRLGSDAYPIWRTLYQ